jgi:hypothetical protein
VLRLFLQNACVLFVFFAPGLAAGQLDLQLFERRVQIFGLAVELAEPFLVQSRVQLYLVFQSQLGSLCFILREQ